MINNLKNAIRKRKLYFVINCSATNISNLNHLLTNNIISSFYTRVQKKRTFLIAFINYSHNFNSSIAFMTKSIKKLSLQKNNNLDITKLNSNFVVNIRLNKTSIFKNNIKFR